MPSPARDCAPCRADRDAIHRLTRQYRLGDLQLVHQLAELVGKGLRHPLNDAFVIKGVRFSHGIKAHQSAEGIRQHALSELTQAMVDGR